MKIRLYKHSDRESVLDIQYKTGYMGKDLGLIIDTPSLFNSELNDYLKDHQEHIFVAVEGKKVVGYVLGVANDSERNGANAFLKNTLVNMLKYFFITARDRKFVLTHLKTICKYFTGSAPEAHLKHPKDAGHVHINLLPHAQGKGVGTTLLRRFIDSVRKKGCKRLHADTWLSSHKSSENFWKKNGFVLKSETDSNMWKFATTSPVKMRCYVKEL